MDASPAVFLGTVSAVVISILHLPSTTDLLAALTAVGRHLTPGGVFAFDINPDVRMLARPLGQRFPVMELTTATFGSLCVEETHDYEPVTQVNRGTWYGIRLEQAE